MRSRLDRQQAKADERIARTNRGDRAIATNRKAFHEYEIVEKLEAVPTDGRDQPAEPVGIASIELSE